MSEVMDLLSAELSQDRIREIAKHLGTDPSQTEAAISTAIPTMIGAMGRTAETSDGASRLTSQMQGIGGGSIGDILGSLLGGSERKSSNAPRSNEDILPPSFSNSRPNSPSGGGLFDNLPESSRSSLDQVLGPGNEVRSAPSPRSSPNPSSRNTNSLPDASSEVFGGRKGRVEEAIGKSSGMDLSKVGPLIAILAPIVLGAMRSKASAAGRGQIQPGDLSDMMRRERSSVESKSGGSLLGRLLDQDGDGDFDLNDILKIGLSFLSRRK